MADLQGNFVRIDPKTGLPGGAKLGRYLGVYSLMEYDTLTNLAKDAQAAITQAISDAGAQGGIVFFPPGVYTAVGPFPLVDGISYRGAGQNITTIQQPDGVNTSLFVSTPTKGIIGFLNHMTVEGMRLKKLPTPGGTVINDTIGSAIEVNCRVGELCHFKNLLITAWPKSGIRLNHSGQPVVIRDIHTFGNKEYGIDLRRSSGDVWHMVNVDTVSGDNHGKGLIHISGGGSHLETIRLANIKVESIVDGTMPCVIDLDALSGMTVQIENLSLYAIKPVPAIIRVSSSTVRLYCGIIRAGGPSGASVEGLTNLIDDIPAARQVPYTGSRFGFNYDSAVGIVAPVPL